MYEGKNYASFTLSRKLTFDEFRQMGRDELAELLNGDISEFRRLIYVDPCKVREPITVLSNFSNYLITADSNLYECCLKDRANEIVQLYKEVWDTTRSNDYSIEYELSSEVTIPASKVSNGNENRIVQDQTGGISGIKIKREGTFHELVQAGFRYRDLRRLMGFLSLYSRQIVEHTGKAEGWAVDPCGNKTEVLHGSGPAKVHFVNWDQVNPTSLKVFESIAIEKSVVWDLIYSATVAESQGLLRGAYLNYYLALQIMKQDENYLAEPYSDFRHIRNGIAHTEGTDDATRNYKEKEFLKEKFGSSYPDWESDETSNKLQIWVSRIREELRNTFFSN